MEKFPVLDKLLNKDSEISALLGTVASGIMKCVELVFILFSHKGIVEGTRLLVLRIPLDFH
jgi:hypothetical protein